MKRLAAVLVVVLAGLCSLPLLQAQSPTTDPTPTVDRRMKPEATTADATMLAGLWTISEVNVLLDEEYGLRVGLTEESVERIVRLRLLGAGWTIEDDPNVAAEEYVSVLVDVFPLASNQGAGESTGHYVVLATLGVRQPIWLDRHFYSKPVYGYGETWSRYEVGYYSRASEVPAGVREDLNAMCDILLDDWHKKNPQ